MTPEEKSLLEETYRLAAENNAMLKSIQRNNRMTTIMRWLYWAVIIVMSFGAYYFIQPYLNMLLGMSGQGTGIQGLTNSLNQAQDAASQLQGLLK